MDSATNPLARREAVSRAHRGDVKSANVAIPVAFLIAGFCFAMVDFPVGNYFAGHPVDGLLGELLDAAEHFGTPFGQGLILLSLTAIAQWQEPRAIRIFIGACAAGISANIVKLLIARTRPREFEFEGASLLDGFTEWFPFGAGGSAIQSFPSAHTASAFGFAALMCWAFPTGRSAFLVLACLVGLQRICSSAHFPSDVLIGAALGWTVGRAFVESRRIREWFDRLESWLSRRSSTPQS